MRKNQNTLYFAKITVEMLSKYMAGLSRIVLCVKQSQKNCEDYKQLLRHACNFSLQARRSNCLVVSISILTG